MTDWEYRVQYWKLDDFRPSTKKRLTTTFSQGSAKVPEGGPGQDVFNELGGEGWELVGFSIGEAGLGGVWGKTSVVTAVFKKPRG